MKVTDQSNQIQKVVGKTAKIVKISDFAGKLGWSRIIDGTPV